MPSAALLADTVAEQFVAAAGDAIQARGEFVVALSGGATPRGTYERLATEPLVTPVMWSRVQVVWGDERCVPPDHAASNYRMARETLLDHVPVPAAHVHRIHGEDDPVAAAACYDATLRALLKTPAGPPRALPGTRIDLVVLGLGDDGHTASLFPGSAAAREQTRWVVAEHAAAVSMWRVTLTAAVINAAADVLFLVSGGAKAAILRRVLEGPHRPQELPAQRFAPSNGRVRWCVDAA
ncbi:MAG TPA: 6-phosphogluconolactonase, partial [Gemmatimonadales bacterium]|nr:6-phosphogluconolactonase [Gemmatimonadales bacterium]